MVSYIYLQNSGSEVVIIVVDKIKHLFKELLEFGKFRNMKAFLIVLLLAVAATSGAKRGGMRPTGRYMLMPGGDGKVYLVDLDQDTVDRAVTENDVTFNLYTRSNPSSPQYLRIGDTSSLGNFDASKPIRLICHGWTSNAGSMNYIKDAWLQVGDYNVINIDWSGPASNINYAQAKADTVGVGELAADLLIFLGNQGAKLSWTEFAGHSLGAHIAGIAGNRLGGNLAKIVGMDPAGPLYDGSSMNQIDASDANFVQIIHTNGGLLGWGDPMGHSDFYPNGGASQPGCGLDLTGACSHGRSHDYFAESIVSSVPFTGTRCDSWNSFTNFACAGNPTNPMGEPASTSTTGVFYLYTNDQSPYAQG